MDLVVAGSAVAWELSDWGASVASNIAVSLAIVTGVGSLLAAFRVAKAQRDERRQNEVQIERLSKAAGAVTAGALTEWVEADEEPVRATTAPVRNDSADVTVAARDVVVDVLPEPEQRLLSAMVKKGDGPF